MKRFKVVSIYTNNACNLSCDFCYVKNKVMKDKKDEKWFLALPKYLAKITDQVSFASYEPLLFPKFVEKFSAKCAKYGLIVNITTNGTLIKNFTDKELTEMLKDITMVSISYDHWKVKTRDDEIRYINSVKRLTSLGVRVGCNLLVDKEILDNIEDQVKDKFVIGAERVFILHPKPKSLLGIKNIKPYINRIRKLMGTYKHLYVDDYFKMVDRYGYDDWKSNCHYGVESLSVDPSGGCSGCSFAPPVFHLKEPKDILKMADYKFEKKMKCVM